MKDVWINNLELEKVYIEYGEQTITFLPSENQTWYGWATDPNNTNDIDLSSVSSGLTLKGLIIQSHGTNNKEIAATYSSSIYSLNLMVTRHYFEKQHTTDTIIRGKDYIISRFSSGEVIEFGSEAAYEP